MDNTVKHKAKIISPDDINIENAIRTRSIKRTALASVLFLIGLGLVVAGAFPLVAKSVIPLMWVDYANTHGWTEEMQKIGNLLLSQGRIEVVPTWLSFLAFGAAFFSFWLGIHIFLNRKNPGVTGDAFKKSYWVTFHWISPPKHKTKVNFVDVKKRENRGSGINT